MKKIFILLIMILFFYCVGLHSITIVHSNEDMTDDEFLEMIEKKIFDYFYNEANPDNGLVADRTKLFEENDFNIASSASTGFGLTAVCVGHARGWLTYEQAYERVYNTLYFFRYTATENHGFFYHWMDMDTGNGAWDMEFSSVDTAWLLCGVLYAGQYFKGTAIETLADAIYRRVDWQWMSNGSQFISMGYKEGAFISSFWSAYNEGMIVNFLAIGSPTYSMPVTCWTNMDRDRASYGGYNAIWQGTLFTHQYPQDWLDLRKKHDSFTNYFQNSRNATLQNRAYCIDNMSMFSTYGERSWGLTAGDDVDGGYTAYGIGNHDGTIQPNAPGGSVMFAPQECIAALRYMHSYWGEKIFGTYGFSDGYNTDPKKSSRFNIDGMWRDEYAIGISQGAMFCAIENYRSGMIWKEFMNISYIHDAMTAMGFSDENYIDSFDNDLTLASAQTTPDGTWGAHNPSIIALNLNLDSNFTYQGSDASLKVTYTKGSGEEWEYFGIDNLIHTTVNDPNISDYTDYSQFSAQVYGEVSILCKFVDINGQESGDIIAQPATNSSGWTEVVWDISGIDWQYCKPSVVKTILFFPQPGQQGSGTFYIDSLKVGSDSNENDSIAPAQISDLTADPGANTSEIILTWTASGDDGNSGTATNYVIRYSTVPIQNAASWNDAIDITGEPDPQSSGTPQTMTVSNLFYDTLYFAIRAVDNKNNWSVISNSPSAVPKLPSNDQLYQNFPNPFDPYKGETTIIQYDLSDSANIFIKIYNIAGELVREWNRGSEARGRHNVSWDGKNADNRRVASGLYIVVLKKNGNVLDRKRIIVNK